ncbi:MAG TPA: ABC transporter ATP-binding protein, partial [Lachnospiraceae bacterium]|nr:ABC transporter ATP-binding protein [Lachnospiraceae bacterium]
MPLLYTKMSKKAKRQRAESLLDAVGLSDKYDAYPSMLSGGEQQRVAIATALANQPELLLMDEPTGAVDKNTSLMLQALFRKLNRELGITVIIVTHDLSLADQVDRVVMIADGKISSERILKEKYQETIISGAGFNENAEDPDKKDEDEKNKKEEKEETHDEYLVLDKAGRVRLSEEVRKAAGIEGNRVKIDVVDGKIIISS